MGFLEEGKKIDIIGEVCSLSLPVNTLLSGEPFESFVFCVFVILCWFLYLFFACHLLEFGMLLLFS